MAETARQVAHDLAEDAGVHVLADHVEQEPVADPRLADDDVDGVPTDEPQSHVEEVGAHPRTDHQHHAEGVVDERQAGQAQEPEPQEHVQLLVDDVERQDAEDVHHLDVARGTVLAEGALGHAREDPDERVDAVLGVLLRVGDHVQAERHERPVKEPVHQEDLACKTKTWDRNFAISLQPKFKTMI